MIFRVEGCEDIGSVHVNCSECFLVAVFRRPMVHIFFIFKIGPCSSVPLGCVEYYLK